MRGAQGADEAVSGGDRGERRRRGGEEELSSLREEGAIEGKD